EVVEGGDLEDNRMGMMLAAQTNALPEEARSVLQQAAIKQAVDGLIYLRDQNVVHFDVKGANFMMTADGTIKVADFGLGAISTDSEGKQSESEKGNVTPGYAPGDSADQLSNKFDTYALGKVIQVMQTNAMSAGAGDFSNITGAIKRLTEAMSSDNPADRP